MKSNVKQHNTDKLHSDRQCELFSNICCTQYRDYNSRNFGHKANGTLKLKLSNMRRQRTPNREDKQTIYVQSIIVFINKLKSNPLETFRVEKLRITLKHKSQMRKNAVFCNLHRRPRVPQEERPHTQLAITLITLRALDCTLNNRGTGRGKLKSEK